MKAKFINENNINNLQPQDNEDLFIKFYNQILSGFVAPNKIPEYKDKLKIVREFLIKNKNKK
jgi:hypothetical protein